MEFAHTSVMPAEVIRYLGCKPGGVYVDGTLGGGGHTRLILDATAPDGVVIGMDCDPEALSAAASTLAEYADRTRLVRGNFRDLKKTVSALGFTAVNGILLDVGVSSYQFDAAKRGFSFRLDSRLDMRMDPDRETSAYELVNGSDEAALERIFRLYGEERFSSRIARAIVRARASEPVESTRQLALIVVDAIPAKFHGKAAHPATKVFQALRIAVNDELENLRAALNDGFCLLAPGGRFVVISFHSLEDRIVKAAFREFSTGCICPPRAPKCICGRKPEARLLTRRSVTANDSELESNPRARSARLRAVEKI